MKQCEICGKTFEVLYPELWRFKRIQGTHHAFFCSWGCIRKYDAKEKEKMEAKTARRGRPKKAAEEKAEVKATEVVAAVMEEGNAAEEPAEMDRDVTPFDAFYGLRVKELTDAIGRRACDADGESVRHWMLELFALRTMVQQLRAEYSPKEFPAAEPEGCHQKGDGADHQEER